MYSHRLSRLASLGVWVWWEIMRRPPSRKIVRRVVFVVQRAISTDDVTRTLYDDADVRQQRSIFTTRRKRSSASSGLLTIHASVCAMRWIGLRERTAARCWTVLDRVT